MVLAPGDDRISDFDGLDRVQTTQLCPPSSKEVGETRSRAHRQGGRESRGREVIVEFVLLYRNVVEATEIGVVSAYGETCAHHLDVARMA